MTRRRLLENDRSEDQHCHTGPLVFIYLGDHGSKIQLVGSATDRLVELAPCHVLVVK